MKVIIEIEDSAEHILEQIKDFFSGHHAEGNIGAHTITTEGEEPPADVASTVIPTEPVTPTETAPTPESVPVETAEVAAPVEETAPETAVEAAPEVTATPEAQTPA